VNRPPRIAREVLEAGRFCDLSVETARGPHTTPLVFALSDDRIWVTTARSSVKARAWDVEPRVAGLVRAADRAVTFVGVARMHDVLNPETWAASIVSAPALARASLRFSRKNGRFFAGYAVDAPRVPLAWTPPGRVFAGIEIARGAVLEAGAVLETWGGWEPGGLGSHATYRARGRGSDPLGAAPAVVSDDLGRGPSDATLTIEGEAGSVVVPARWSAGPHELVVAVSFEHVSLGEPAPEERATLVIERSSSWRAREMSGAMVQGAAALFDPATLESGRRSAASRLRASGAEPDGSVLIRIDPDRLVWWRGWSSGSADVSHHARGRSG
jgi:pyridoxamine 5'-phosphate oxidase-like protein